MGRKYVITDDEEVGVMRREVENDLANAIIPGCFLGSDDGRYHPSGQKRSREI